MGKELIALLVVLLMTALYSLNNSASLYGPASSSPTYKQSSKNSSHIEVRRDGVGRIYPLNEVSRNYLPVNGEPFESGDRIEYVSPENSEHSGQIRRGRMKGHTLLLFKMPVNLNEASIDDLMALPGIGFKTAEAIVEFRKEKGPFKTKAELMNVRGIGRKKYKKIKDKLIL